MNAALFILAFVLVTSTFALAYSVPFGWRDYAFQHSKTLTGCFFATGLSAKPIPCYSPMVKFNA